MKSTLANLYRQATRQAADAALPDADALVALAQGERRADAERIVADVAQSALQSDLLHFTRALEPASAALSAELAAALADQRAPAAHARGQTMPARAAAGRWRNLRRIALGGCAAAVLAAVAVWSQLHQTSVIHTPVATTATATPVQDRIFAALENRPIAAKQQRDEIFHGDFRGDVIFRASGG